MISRFLPPPVRHTFNLDLATSLMGGLFAGTVINFAQVVARRLGADATLLALVVAAPMAGSLLTPLSVYIPPAWRFRSLLFCWFMARAIFLLCLFIASPGPFVLLVVLFYVLMALPLPAYVDLMRAVYPANVRGRAMAYVRVGGTAMITIGTPVAGWLMDRVGYGIPFAVAAFVGMISVLAFAQIRPGPIVAQRASLRQVVAVLAEDRRFAVYSLGLMFMGTGLLVAAPLFPIYQVDYLHLSYSQVGLLGLLGSAVWMVSNLFVGNLMDRNGALWLMRLSTGLQTLLPLCYLFASDVRLVAVAYVLTGILNAAGELGWMNVVLLFARPERVPDYTALHMLLVGIRGLIGPLLAAALLALPGMGMALMFSISFAIQLVGFLIVARVRAT